MKSKAVGLSYFLLQTSSFRSTGFPLASAASRQAAEDPGTNGASSKTRCGRGINTSGRLLQARFAVAAVSDRRQLRISDTPMVGDRRYRTAFRFTPQ